MQDQIGAAASPWIISTLTALASLLFGLPLGVVISAFGGAYWAVYRNPSMTVIKSAWMIIVGMMVACALVEGVHWAGDALFGWNMPQRPTAFLLAFATIDKDFRDWLIGFFKAKFESKEVRPNHD
jgi:hypothetical protein